MKMLIVLILVFGAIFGGIWAYHTYISPNPNDKVIANAGNAENQAPAAGATGPVAASSPAGAAAVAATGVVAPDTVAVPAAPAAAPVPFTTGGQPYISKKKIVNKINNAYDQHNKGLEKNSKD